MAITAFDTYKFIRRLEQAGMPLKQAEVQAEVLTEAFTVNLEELVSKEFLDSRLDARFAEQDARIDTRFAEQDARIDTRFAEQQAHIDIRFAEQAARIDGLFRFFVWTQAAVLTAVIFPYLQKLFAL